jgi:hypothetical protein
MSHPAEPNPYETPQSESPFDPAPLVEEPDTPAVEIELPTVEIMSIDAEMLALAAEDLKIANRWMVVGILVCCGVGCLNSLQLLYEFYRWGPGAACPGTFKLLAILTQFSGAALLMNCCVSISEFVKDSVAEKLSTFFQADTFFWKVTGFLFLISLGFAVVGVLCIVLMRP